MKVSFKDSCGNDISINASKDTLNSLAIFAGEAARRYDYLGMAPLVKWAKCYADAIDSTLRATGYYNNTKGETTK